MSARVWMLSKSLIGLDWIDCLGSVGTRARIWDTCDRVRGQACPCGRQRFTVRIVIPVNQPRRTAPQGTANTSLARHSGTTRLAGIDPPSHSTRGILQTAPAVRN